MTPTRLAATLALLGLLPCPLVGQARDSARADTTYLLDPVVVTTSRLAAHQRTGFTVTTVDADELGRRAPRSMVDVFRDQPGVFVDESVGPGGPTILRIRGGEEVFTHYLVDGVQVNQNGGFFDMMGLQLSGLERVDIARGPQSAVHGSSAVTGLVHFITAPGRPGSPELTSRFEGGAATEHGGTWRADAGVRGGTERLLYSVAGGAAYSRGVWDIANDTRSRNAAVRLDLLASEAWSLRLSARNAFVESNLPVRDLGGTRVPLDPNARDEFDRTILSATARWASPRSGTHALAIGHYREDFAFEDEFDGIDNPPDGFAFDANLRFDAGLRRTTARYVGTARIGGGAAEVAWGGQLEREALDNVITGDFEDELALDRNSGALFTELGWLLSNGLSLSFGGRAERFEGLSWELTPRAGARWKLSDGRLILRSAVGRAYKAPNLQQQFVENPFIAANPDIRPETSVSSEIGADLVDRAGAARLSVTVFRQSFDDLIRTITPEGETRQTSRNVGRARSTGFEWSARARVGRLLYVGADGAYTSSEVLDNRGLPTDEYPVGEPLPFRPGLVAAFHAEVADPGRWSLRARVSRIGGQDVLSNRFGGARRALDAYTLVGLNASLRVRPEVRVYGRVDNLFDTSYSTGFDRPGAPGSATVGVEVSLGGA